MVYMLMLIWQQVKVTPSTWSRDESTATCHVPRDPRLIQHISSTTQVQEVVDGLQAAVTVVTAG